MQLRDQLDRHGVEPVGPVHPHHRHVRAGVLDQDERRRRRPWTGTVAARVGWPRSARDAPGGSPMTDEPTGAAIEDFLVEDRTFPPPEAFKKDTLVARRSSTTRPTRTTRGSGPARPPTSSTGTRSGTRSSSGSCPSPSGSSAGSSTCATTPSTATSLAGHGDKVAYHWEGEPGDTRTITYADLHARGAALRQRAQGPRRRQGRPRLHLHADGPRAAGRDARLRPHRRARTRSCSAASAPTRSIDRINDAECKVVITADGGFRRGRPVDAEAQRRHRARRPPRASSTSSS